jgi:hypothetical protein
VKSRNFNRLLHEKEKDKLYTVDKGRTQYVE